MAALNKRLIDDTSRLISLYLNPGMQGKLQKLIEKNPQATYRGRPIYVYMEVAMAAMTPQDRGFVKSSKLYQGKNTKSEQVIAFFELLENNRNVGYQTLTRLTSQEGLLDINQTIPPVQIAALNKIEEAAQDNRKKLKEIYEKVDPFTVEETNIETAVPEAEGAIVSTGVVSTEPKPELENISKSSPVSASKPHQPPPVSERPFMDISRSTKVPDQANQPEKPPLQVKSETTTNPPTQIKGVETDTSQAIPIPVIPKTPEESTTSQTGPIIVPPQPASDQSQVTEPAEAKASPEKQSQPEVEKVSPTSTVVPDIYTPPVTETPPPTPITPPPPRLNVAASLARRGVKQALNSNFVKDSATGLEIAAKKFITRHPQITASLLGGIVGWFTAYGATGQTGAGMAGAAIGVTLPLAIPQAGTSSLGLGGILKGLATSRSLAMTAGKLGFGLSNPVGWAMLAANSKALKGGRQMVLNTTKIVIIAVFAVILGVPLMSYMSNLKKSTALLPPYKVEVDADDGTTPDGTIIPGLELKKSGPEAVANGEDIKNNILVKYSGNAVVDIIDQIPTGTTLIKEQTTGVFKVESDKVVWSLKDNSPSTGSASIKTYSFDITLKPSANDIYVVNTVSAKALSVVPGGGEPPNTNTCSGKYKLDNPMGKNYGDPSCNFTKDDLYALLQQQDPQYADDWYFNIIPCESSYNPNAFYAFSPDSAGAWGLYQMGRGKNGEFDHGDVPWQNQTTNAINYNKLIKGNFRYWACARYLWR